MLDVQTVVKSYGENIAVNRLSFQLKRGDLLGLVGSNGSGKTTTFRMILGLLQPDLGQILLDHQSIQLADRRIFGYLPEERSLYRELTLLRQLYFLGQLKGMSKADIERAIAYWSDLLELKGYLNSHIKTLSKGNQQKVQFLGCLLHDPQICIFDEPFSGLDPYNLELLKHVFLELKQKGKMILLSTHRLDHIESFCSQVILLKKGETILQGEIAKLRQESKTRYLRVQGNVQYHQLQMIEEISQIKKEGKGYRLQFDNEEDAKKTMRYLLKKADLLQLSYEFPTLLDLFMAQNLEC